MPENEDRDREYAFFKQAIETAYTNASSQLELRSHQLATEIREDFYKRVQRIMWTIGVVGVIATLGGFVSINGIVKNSVDEQIAAQQKEIEKLKSSALEDVVALRTQAGVAASESKETAEKSQREMHDVLASAKANVAAQSKEMNQQVVSAKQLIADTVSWWESVKEVHKAATREAAKDPRKDGDAAVPGANASAPKPEPREQAILRMMKCVKEGGVVDADVELFIAVMEGDLEATKRAVDRGGNPVAKDLDVLRKHKDVLMKQCPGLVPNGF
ncbi:MAG: hypothetical protein JWO97_4069 [Acidobacteria bacterium]|nr:hypothetical protein [Acidobacteriota bacterium]